MGAIFENMDVVATSTIALYLIVTTLIGVALARSNLSSKDWALGGGGMGIVMIAVGIGSVPTYARLVRAQVMSAKEREYVEAARAMGARDYRLLIKHIFPNVISSLIVLGSLGVANAILSAAALSFIGLGAQPPSPEWGAMLSQGRDFLRDQWWITTFPGIFIALTVLGFNLVGDGLRDAFDPQGSR